MICNKCGFDNELEEAVTWHDALDEKKDQPWHEQTLEEKQATIQELAILDDPYIGTAADPLADEQMGMLQGYYRALSRDLASLEKSGGKRLVDTLWVDIYKDYLSARIKVNMETTAAELLKELIDIPCFKNLLINDGFSIIVSKSKLEGCTEPDPVKIQ